jgi:NADH-quinone oxidoreductase subunit A
MLSPYFPILLFIVFAIILGLVALSIGALISPSRPYAAKLATYECGFPTFGEAQLPMDIRYYRIAILFIIFDIETIFLIPWALSFRQLGSVALIAIAPFLAILLVGFAYEWKRGALEWN